MGDKQHPVERVAVESSNIKSIGFCAECASTYVEFNNGALWKYPTGQELHEQFTAAESKGKFFYAHLRPLGGKRV